MILGLAMDFSKVSRRAISFFSRGAGALRPFKVLETPTKMLKEPKSTFLKAERVSSPVDPLVDPHGGDHSNLTTVGI